MIELNKGINHDLPDATFDLDGTVFKMTILEMFIEWLSEQRIFEPIPADITKLKEIWKKNNTEETYTEHLSRLVQFFIQQIPGKSYSQLYEAANIIASQQEHRKWNIVTSIIAHLRETHNIISVSLMPEWLMVPFAERLGFVALIGSRYIQENGVFTGEAHSIDKAVEYIHARNGNTSMLDIHMGDTIGDSSLFKIAKRPIFFNPSATLLHSQEPRDTTIILSHKDVVTVMNSGPDIKQCKATIWTPPFDINAILSAVYTQ